MYFKIILEHFNEITSLGVRFICRAMSLHPQSIPSIPRQKYVKISILREISASKVSNVYRNNMDHMYPHQKIRLWVRLTFDQASGHADLCSDVPPKDIWWPSVIPH